MATTVSTATLTVSIQETITLNGTKQGATVNAKFGKIKQVDERVLTVPTHEVALMSLSSSAAAGTYVTSKVRYVRFTNLDDTNYVRLTFVSGSKNRFDTKLEAGRSMMFTNAAVSGSAAGASFNTFSNFTSVKATADSSAVDIGLFVATI